MGFLGFVTGEKSSLDSVYSWFVAAIACVFLALLAGYNMTPGVLFVLIQERYDVTKQKAAYPVNALVASSFIYGLFAGPILHRFKARKTLLLSSGLGVLGSCLSVFSPTNDPITWLTICMAIRGAGSSLAMPALWHVVGSHFDRHLSKALVLVVMAFPVGGLVLPGIIRSSAEAYGLGGSWLIHGAVYCQAILLALVIKSYRHPNLKVASIQLESGKRNNDEDAKDKITKEKSGRDAASFGSLLAALLAERNFYLIGSSVAVANACLIGVRTTIIDYGKDIELEPELNRYMMEILSCSDVARIVTAIIIDRRLCYEETLSCVASLVAASTLLLMTLTKGFAFAFFAISYNVCFAVCVASSGTMFSSLGRDTMATASGITLSFSGLLQLALPFLIGLFRDTYGSYKYLYYSLAFLNFIFALAFGISRVKHWFKHHRI